MSKARAARMIRSRATFVVIHARCKSEPSLHHSPTSASKGEEVGKRPIVAAPFAPTTRLCSSHVQHTVTASCCAFSRYLLTNTADRPTDNTLLYRTGGHLCSRICQNPRYLDRNSSVEREDVVSRIRLCVTREYSSADETVTCLLYLGKRGGFI